MSGYKRRATTSLAPWRKRYSPGKAMAKRRAKAAFRRYATRYSRPSLPLSGFPESKLVKLRYVETIPITESTLSYANYLFSCNNIYDPNTTGTGHQPYGHDQWAALYNHYEVLGSKITVIATASLATNLGAIVGIQLSDDQTIAVNTNELMENNKSRYRVLVSGNGPVRLVQNWSQKKNFPGKRGDDNLQALFGQSPTEQMYYNIYMGSGSGLVPLTSVCLQVQIDYIVKIFERKQWGQS